MFFLSRFPVALACAALLRAGDEKNTSPSVPTFPQGSRHIPASPADAHAPTGVFSALVPPASPVSTRLVKPPGLRIFPVFRQNHNSL
ncbi:hypothetical protein OPIT5_20135 [Opitutaceae bacterium TAV5]|nr:hypothetical protein OPIT5_20135 [Opitutaceae bacterium TAV5]